jgi:hypothetical protein
MTRDVAGEAIVRFSWATIVVFAVTGGLDLVLDSFDSVAVVVCVGLFAASFPVWISAFALAIGRSARGDDIAVASLFFLQGSAPAAVKKQLLGAFAASILVCLATAWANPFAVLVPMLHLGLVGLWAARHGTFPPRRAAR